MNNRPFHISLPTAAWTLILLPFLLSGWKIIDGYATVKQLYPAEIFRVQFHFSAPPTRDSFSLSAFVPRGSERQEITGVRQEGHGFNQSYRSTPAGDQLLWTRRGAGSAQPIVYSFLFTGRKTGYTLPSDPPPSRPCPPELADDCRFTARIQSDHPLIHQAADSLTRTASNLQEHLRRLFDHVAALPAPRASAPRDALTTLRFGRAEAEGKSRLLAAFFRATGIPARLAGGIPLSPVTGGSDYHRWVEAYLHGEWVPFDPTRGHFAGLPAHYLLLFRGETAPVTQSAGLPVGFSYTVERGQRWEAARERLSWTLWSLPRIDQLPAGFVRTLLLFPLCALVVALCRNVVGLKTFGVFLPALIGLSISDLGLFSGLAAFTTVILITSLLHFPLARWNLLHTPKLVVMLVGLVGLLLTAVYLGMHTGSGLLYEASTLPVVILTLTAERFARKTAEEGYRPALEVLGHTLLVTVLCYALCQADFLIGILLTFPELYAVLAGIVLLLGRWIGLRLTEYMRFRPMLASLQPNRNH